MLARELFAIPSISGLRFSVTTAPMASVFPHRTTGCGKDIVLSALDLGVIWVVSPTDLVQNILNILQCFSRVKDNVWCGAC